MKAFSEYQNAYSSIQLQREDGVLEMRLHHNNGPWRWSRDATAELEAALLDVGRDRENGVIILCGTGTEFTGPAKMASNAQHAATHGQPEKMTPELFDKIYWKGKHTLTNLLNIEVPMISAINGPVLRHPEIPLLCDIVLASENATIEDSAHFTADNIPGDGVHIVFPLLMGLNRARYFLLTSQVLTAQQAREYGLVNEVLAPEQLLPRAHELARQLMRRSPLVRRYTRVLLTEDLKRRMHDLLGYGLALEGLGKM